ncbi:MAG: hypothetical protein IJR59_00635 [Firmicutes bacterium]|nr:hypothetical protein [Bacillota bacterium]
MKLSRKSFTAIIVSFAIIILTLLGISHYTKAALERYRNTPIRKTAVYTSQKYPDMYRSCIEDYFFVMLDGRKLYMTYDIVSPDLGHQYCIAKITDLEYCLITDCYHNIILPLGDGHTDSFSLIPHEISTFDRTTSETLLRGRCIQYTFFSLLIALPLYLRHALPFEITVFGMIGFILRKYGKKDIRALCFALFSVVFMLLTEILLHIPALTELYCKTMGKFLKPTYRIFYNGLMGINIYAFALFFIIGLISIFVIYRQNRLRRTLAYALPTLLLLAAQWLVFYRLMSGKYFYSDISVFIYSYLGINGGTGILAKTAAFTLFFALGFITYFVFSFIADNNIGKNLYTSAAFSAANAFMCCLAVYVLNFGNGILNF